MGRERWGRVWVCGVVGGEGERGHAEAHAGRLLAFGLTAVSSSCAPLSPPTQAFPGFKKPKDRSDVVAYLNTMK